MSRSPGKGDLPRDGDRRRRNKASRPPSSLQAVPDSVAPSLLRAIAQSADRKEWLFAAALVVAVFLVYQPAWYGGFVWDDDLHLLNNPVLKPGGLLQTWAPGTYINYWPLTFTVYRLEFEMWGLNPLGFHLVNIALHAISALLVWRILECLRIPGAMLAAAIFALHPVCVESVAWIAQLKNTLSLALALLSVLFYLRHEREGGSWRFALSLGLFLLSALAKGMALTLPVVLLACVWWQRRSLGWRDLLRVLPYLLIGVLMVGMEVYQQHVAAGTGVVRSDSLLSRAAVAGCAVWFYLWKVIWPTHLSFVYPRWNISERDLWAYLPGVLLAVLLALAWWRRSLWGRPVVMLIVCYVALLLPVLGFVSIYFMEYSLVADHWQYAAMIVPCAAVAGAVATLGRRLRLHGPGSYVLCVVLVAILAELTWRQSGMYADGETLYEATIKENPECSLAHNNLGLALANRGLIDEALVHYRKAVQINPKDAVAHNNLATALEKRGLIDEAVAEYRRALEIDPGYAHARNNLGEALAKSGRIDEAIAYYRKAVKVDSRDAQLQNNLGAVLARRGLIDEAMVHYRTALDIDPNDALAHYNLGGILANRGSIDEAIEHYRKALDVNPNYVRARDNLGGVLAMRGRIDEAIAQYRMALQIDPNDAVAHCNLGGVLGNSGRLDEAIAHLRAALRINPDYQQARRNLGIVLKMKDNGR